MLLYTMVMLGHVLHKECLKFIYVRCAGVKKFDQ